MYGQGEPILTSQYSVLLLKGAGNSWSTKDVSDNTLGSVKSHFCSSAIKSWLRMSLSSALSSVLESVSATVLFSPFTYRRSLVNCEMWSRCLSSRAVYLTKLFCMAVVSGLWSVKITKCRPSRRCWACKKINVSTFYFFRFNFY